jgi:DNA-binding transcriptional LysR family regulator
MNSKTDLNLLQYVAAVKRTGSLSGAARELAVNHATVFRRITQFEKDLGVRLFEREGGRYLPTPAGEELAAIGASMRSMAEQCLLKVAGRDLRPSGVVRITTTDSIATTLLGPILGVCRERYPLISLHLTIDNAMLNLSKRDADIALRASRNPPDYLVGKRIASLALAVYGSESYLATHNSEDLGQHEWIALGESHERHRTLRWLEKIKPLDQVACRFDGFTNIAQACANGLGLALLPCFLGDTTASLRRVVPPAPELASELWLLTHPDLRATYRIKAIVQTLQRELSVRTRLIEGRAR